MNNESQTRASRARIRLFVGLVSVLGILCIGAAVFPWHHTDVLEFTCYLVLTAVASGLKVLIPGYEVTLSVGFIFFFVSIGSMSLSETVALGITAASVQCFWKAAKRPSLGNFVFNLSQLCIALTGAFWLNQSLVRGPLEGRFLIALLLSAAFYFLLNTLPVAVVVSLSERTAILSKWRETFAWMCPFYLVGAAIAALVQFLNRHAGWEISVVVMPALYLIYRSYNIYIGRMADMKAHMQEMGALHLRTIEALALAIDAKDQTTGDHVHRVRVYALELAGDLNLSPAETDALRAAAVLHDIGKLAVPEHIISKPGKLTPEEFEKMKIHPIVGAEILEQVEFPYPVVPIVRSHHERWDGTGYPDGLKGEEIPIGARILSAVDCLDALASDRQYRRALPLDEAMARVEQEAGKTFDPRIVAALKARYLELEKLARSHQGMEKPQLSVNIKVAPGAAPAAGYADAERVSQVPAHAITARLVRDHADDAILQCASTGDFLSSIAMGLRRQIVFDAFAIYGVSGDDILPRFALGEDSRKLLELKTCSGQGLLGWVVLTVRAIRNANPAVDLGTSTGLRSALVAPICLGKEIVGLIALYSTRPDAFSDEDLHELAEFQQVLAANMHNAASLIPDQADGFAPEPQKQPAGLSSQIVFGHS
ncbi:MAG TPA: HD domain-containing phosphohydrolase [Candidatus Angelobacter sp.]|nr:HD domain-containing phosphohydrolase [Candidatus Angelobacter sp.]